MSIPAQFQKDVLSGQGAEVQVDHPAPLLRGRVHDSVRVAVSASASAPIDSLVFLVLAFGSSGLHFFDGQLVGKIASSVVIGIPLVLLGRRFLAAKRGDIVPA